MKLIILIEGHNKHSLHGRGKAWQRNDVERLIRLMVMQHYLDEELFITRDEVAVAYLRVGPKAQELLSGKAKVYPTFFFFNCFLHDNILNQYYNAL